MRESPTAGVPPLWARLALLAVALCYLYGAAVHIANMLSLSGFSWPQAPLKWRVLDIVYLVADLLVASGLAYRRLYAVVLFYAAALSQIVLYTMLRGWILDVPAVFQPPASAQTYLDGLVIFHVLSLAVVTVALARLKVRTKSPEDPAGGVAP